MGNGQAKQADVKNESVSLADTNCTGTLDTLLLNPGLGKFAIDHPHEAYVLWCIKHRSNNLWYAEKQQKEESTRKYGTPKLAGEIYDEWLRKNEIEDDFVSH